ncbi:hypothetical protein [Lacrimispora sp.]|nr:hypothetical protein [Lacrimispora sp.]
MTNKKVVSGDTPATGWIPVPVNTVYPSGESKGTKVKHVLDD